MSDKYKLERTIDALLDDHSSWIFTQYSATHYSSGMSLWLANGFLHFGLDQPTQRRFSIFWKWRLWRKVKQCIAQQILSTIVANVPLDNASYKTGQWLN